MSYEPVTDNAIDKYFRIFWLYATGVSEQEIKNKYGHGYKTIRRAITYCRKRFSFTTAEELELTIRKKQEKLKEAHQRLQKIQDGWKETIIKKKGGTEGDKNATEEITVSQKFNWNAEVGLRKLIRDYENDINEMKGLLQHKLKGKYDPQTGEFEAVATSGMTFLDCWKLHNPDKDKEAYNV